VKRLHFAGLAFGPALAGFSARALPALAQAPAPATVNFGSVGLTAFDWTLIVADQLGFWTANGIKVETVRTGSVAANAQQLAAGAIDVAEVASTALIQAVLNGAPIVAIMEHIATAPYAVLGRKGLTSIADLKGKTVVVGGPSDITRVFMDKVLASARLKPDDYTYVFVGATEARFAALANGGVDAAILSPPFSLRAADQGYPVLDEVAKYFPAFFFDSLAARLSWTQQHPAVALGFTKGYLQGVRWLYDPANKARAIQMLSATVGVTPDAANESYDLIVTRLRAFSITGVLSDAKVTTVLDALTQTGAIKPPLPPASRFYDNIFVNQANAQFRGRR
jgi:NitT/TauT family transport system substrate-binding protein